MLILVDLYKFLLAVCSNSLSPDPPPVVDLHHLDPSPVIDQSPIIDPPPHVDPPQVIDPPPVVRPKVSELMNDVAAKAPDQWKFFGTMLDIDAAVLNSFEAQHKAEPRACYLDVFTQWKATTNHPYTWATVVEILESEVIGKHDLAVEIKRKYMRRSY